MTTQINLRFVISSGRKNVKVVRSDGYGIGSVFILIEGVFVGLAVAIELVILRRTPKLR